MASKLEIRARIVKIGDVEAVGNNGFEKRVLELKLDGEYPEEFAIEFVKDKMALLDDLIEDTYVTVSYNMRGRKVDTSKDGKPLDKPMFFISLNGWKVEV
jgi:single-strand DNA-binding protein